jgi:hypothetical protein
VTSALFDRVILGSSLEQNAPTIRFAWSSTFSSIRVEVGAFDIRVFAIAIKGRSNQQSADNVGYRFLGKILRTQMQKQ